MIDAWQIYYARVNGADAILLIAAILPDLDIKYMTKICKMFGLTALVEVWLLPLTTSCTMIHASVFDFMIVYSFLESNVHFNNANASSLILFLVFRLLGT